MSLETYGDPDELFLARGELEVNAHRPTFTGDVFEDVAIPGEEGPARVILIDHPCSFRRGEGQLAERVLAARVIPFQSVSPTVWPTGYYSRMPLPELSAGTFHVAELSMTDRVHVTELTDPRRIACLSEFGINLLQQRLTWYLTRFEVPTSELNRAFGHSYEEAELLEEWCETLAEVQISTLDACARFETLVRAQGSDGQTLQSKLLDAQRRSGVRTACRAEARRQAREIAADSSRAIAGSDLSGSDQPA